VRLQGPAASNRCVYEQARRSEAKRSEAKSRSSEVRRPLARLGLRLLLRSSRRRVRAAWGCSFSSGRPAAARPTPCAWAALAALAAESPSRRARESREPRERAERERERQSVHHSPSERERADLGRSVMSVNVGGVRSTSSRLWRSSAPIRLRWGCNSSSFAGTKPSTSWRTQKDRQDPKTQNQTGKRSGKIGKSAFSAHSSSSSLLCSSPLRSSPL